MDRLKGRLALVTGATAGIGEAVARALAARAVRLILAARREERLRALAEELREAHGVEVRTEVLDVRDRARVLALGERLAADGLVPDILVNNAGLASGLAPLHEGDFADWDRMIETNVTGLLNVSRALLPAMVARDSGHVVNIGSIAGRQPYPGGNVYVATKFAVRGLTQALNADLLGTRLRCSNIEPGLVETEFSEVRFHGDSERAKRVYEGYQPLRPEDIADAVVYVVGAPEHVNVQELLLVPTAQRSATLVAKEPAAKA
ncbi:MAG TPA: SDR family NAD(P)-dependent oxidoreductase [Longimicrobiales bacterium]|nr:SDR family NAD(P)-dependent oxidoreductase [Longimicrobiales bacterium]